MCEDCIYYVSPEDALTELGIELPSKGFCWCLFHETAVIRPDLLCDYFEEYV